MAGIQLTGMASGMDTARMVDQLMALERIPRQKLAFQQVAAEARKSALSDITSKLAAFKAAAQGLSSAATWLDVQKVSSADETKLTGVRTGGAAPGTYNVAVTQMAAAARGTYTFTAQASAQPLVVKDAQGVERGQISLAAGATLDDAVTQINARADLGLFAVNVNGNLVLASRTTGASSSFTVESAGLALADDPTDPTKKQWVAGKDLQYTVDGVAGSSATNTAKNAIPGVDLTFKGLTSGVSFTVEGPAPDVSALKDKLKAFVAAYNDAMAGMRSRYEEKPVLDPKSNADAARGSLRSDSGLQQAMSSLRTALQDRVAGAADGMAYLADIGISTGAVTGSGTLNQDAISGKLVFDEAKFDEAFAKDPLKVRQLLAGTTADPRGLGQELSALAGRFSDTGGLIASRASETDASIQSIKESLARFDTRLDARRVRLERQFAAMESALAKSQALSAQLRGQMAGLFVS